MTPEPGPELDVMVAERVMGWKAGPDMWVDPQGRGITKVLKPPERGWWVWSPSTRIQDAWEVVGELATKYGVGITIYNDPNDYGYAKQGQPLFPCWAAVAKYGMPHAICLAALKAVEADPEERARARSKECAG